MQDCCAGQHDCGEHQLADGVNQQDAVRHVTAISSQGKMVCEEELGQQVCGLLCDTYHYGATLQAGGWEEFSKVPRSTTVHRSTGRAARRQKSLPLHLLGQSTFPFPSASG